MESRRKPDLQFCIVRTFVYPGFANSPVYCAVAFLTFVYDLEPAVRLLSVSRRCIGHALFLELVRVFGDLKPPPGVAI
jgi:hypothetical protein